MESRLKELLAEYHLQLKYLPLHKRGCFVKTKGSLPDQITVNSSLSDEEAEKVILHEIDHAENDNDILGDYKSDYRVKICSEHKANQLMISEKVKQCVELGNDASNLNYINLADSLGTHDYSDVRDELRKYLFKP